jgi:hypothetical protein
LRKRDIAASRRVRTDQSHGYVLMAGAVRWRDVRIAKERGSAPPRWHEPGEQERRALAAWIAAERAKGVAEHKLTYTAFLRAKARGPAPASHDLLKFAAH